MDLAQEMEQVLAQVQQAHVQHALAQVQALAQQQQQAPAKAQQDALIKQRCEHPNCTIFSEPYYYTPVMKTHKYLCLKHAGRAKCSFHLCTNFALRKTKKEGFMFCSKHTAKKNPNLTPCQKIGCTNKAKGGKGLETVFCVKHGGSVRCVFFDPLFPTQKCENSAIDKTTKCCRKHGGGYRCAYKDEVTHLPCPKGAINKSSLFCVKHGGGRRCQACHEKGAIHGTDFCQRCGNAAADTDS